MRKQLLNAGLACALAASLQAGTFYVDGVLGNDATGDGSAGAPFKTIQKGVDTASAADAVKVLPATYVEQIEIAKSITLEGVGSGIVIQSPGTLVKSFTTSAVNKPVVYVHDCADVVIAGVILDGNLQGAANYRFYGIAFWNAGGTVYDCEIKNVSNNPPNGAQHGIGVGVYNTDSAPRSFTLDSCYLHDCQKNCTVFSGAGLTVDIKNNTMEGNGPIDYIAQNGIQVVDGTTGVVADNIVTGFEYTPANWYSTGIMIYDPGAEISVLRNAVSGSQYGVYVEAASGSTVTVADNNITGTEAGTTWALCIGNDGTCSILRNTVSLSECGLYLYGAGITTVTYNNFTANEFGMLNDTTVAVNAENNWWGSPNGPTVVTQVGTVYVGEGDVLHDYTTSLMLDYAPWLSGKPATYNTVFLEPTAPSFYVKPSETCVVDLKVANLQQSVSGLQAFLNFSSTYFNSSESDSGAPVVVAGGGLWTELIWNVWNVDGDLDVAVGVDLTVGGGTMADATTATMTLTPTGTEGVTTVVFRPDGGTDVDSTILSDTAGNPVYPTKVNTAYIYIDGTQPTIETIAATQEQPSGSGGDTEVNDVKDCANPATLGTVNISVDARDDNAGLASEPSVVLTSPSSSTVNATYVDEDPDGTFNYTWDVDGTTEIGTWEVKITATDKAGNLVESFFDICVNINQVTGKVELERFLGTGTVPAHTRVVTFVATGGTSIKTWNLTLENTSGAVFDYTLIDVPPGTTAISAKTAWNLREKLAVTFTEGQATADFLKDGVAGWSDATDHYLRAGDLNGSNTVNIQDYGILKLNWLATAPVADLDGSGQVNALDYAYMKLNWFKAGDPQ